MYCAAPETGRTLSGGHKLSTACYEFYWVHGKAAGRVDSLCLRVAHIGLSTNAWGGTCGMVYNWLKSAPGKRQRRRSLAAATQARIYMEESVQKSCWGVMTWTVLALGGVMAFVYLFGGFDVGAVAVAAR